MSDWGAFNVDNNGASTNKKSSVELRAVPVASRKNGNPNILGNSKSQSQVKPLNMAKFSSQQKPDVQDRVTIDPTRKGKKAVVNHDYWDVDDAKANNMNTELDPDNIFGDESISANNDMSIAGFLDVKKVQKTIEHSEADFTASSARNRLKRGDSVFGSFR